MRDPYATRAIFVYGSCINEVRHDTREGTGSEEKETDLLGLLLATCEQSANHAISCRKSLVVPNWRLGCGHEGIKEELGYMLKMSSTHY